MKFMPSLRTRKATRKGIKFAPKHEVRDTLALDDYLQTEVKEYWYDKEDIAEMKRDVNCTASLMDLQVDLHDSPTFCARGVERHTTENSELRSKRIRKALTAVLVEQEFQRVKGSADPEAIAAAYKEHTEVSIVMAASRGLSDRGAILPSSQKKTTALPRVRVSPTGRRPISGSRQRLLSSQAA